MSEQRGWSIAVTLLCAGSGVLLLGVTNEPWRLETGLGALAALVLGWFLLGRRVRDNSAGALVFVGVVIVAASAMAWAHPVLAVMQCIAYPLVWTQVDRPPLVLTGNLLLATGVGVGQAVSFGVTGSSIGQAVIIEVVSLAFSLAFGAWISRIARTSDQRRLLLDELHATQDELAAVSRDAGAAGERERFARDIHDTVAQDLTGLVMLAQQARRALAAGEQDAAADTLATLESSARDALAETRALVAATASPSLDERGLVPALERLAERFGRETGITVSVAAHTAPALDRDREVVLLRCAQEGLANVRKHSGATRVEIVLRADDAGDVTLALRDDGRGFDTDAPASGFGLTGMRERLAIVGGTLALASAPTGTTLSIGIPA